MVLIVDDDESNLELLARTLKRRGFSRVATLSNPFCTRSQCEALHPDVLILDYRMPPTNGLEVLRELRKPPEVDPFMPVLMITAIHDHAVRIEALELGVADFLSRDFDAAELFLRLRNAVHFRRLHQENELRRNHLEEIVRLRTQELKDAHQELLDRLALAAEFRDDETGEHTRRVGRLAASIARAMGQCSAFVSAISYAALLHDLGKIGTPDSILLKKGKLTPAEFDIIRAHPTIGARILDGCTEPVLAMAREIALTHHERWDGRGYPFGIHGSSIPLSGRIVAVADAFDAICSVRPYKPAQPVDAAIMEIMRSRGTHFDPEVVDAFMTLPRSDLR